MSIQSIDSFSSDNFCIKRAELFSDFSFDEKDFKVSNISPSTIFSTATDCCKKTYFLIFFKYLNY